MDLLTVLLMLRTNGAPSAPPVPSVIETEDSFILQKEDGDSILLET